MTVDLSKARPDDSAAPGPPAVYAGPSPVPAQSRWVPQTRPGPSAAGRLTIANRVVERIAARAVAEVPHAAGAARRLLGRALRAADEETAARPSAKVDGHLALVSVGLSVAYPQPAREVAARVREHISERLGELCGLEVTQVDVDVVSLLTEPVTGRPAGRRRPTRVV